MLIYKSEKHPVYRERKRERGKGVREIERNRGRRGKEEEIMEKERRGGRVGKRRRGGEGEIYLVKYILCQLVLNVLIVLSLHNNSKLFNCGVPIEFL